MTQDEALKMAFEALKKCRDRFFPLDQHERDRDLDWGLVNTAVACCEKALAQPEQTNIERHEVNVQKFLGAPQPEQEPVAWADLRKEAQQIVESKFLWKKFIDGTPLSNDIACWMAEFAQQYATPPQRTWVSLTDDDWDEIFGNALTIGEAIKVTEAKLKQKNGYKENT